MFFWIILGFVAWASLALWPAFIAKRKGHSFALMFLLGVVTSFIVAIVVAGLMKDKKATPQDLADKRAAEKALAKEEGLA